MTPLPEPFRLEALQRGLSEPEVAYRWEKACRQVRERAQATGFDPVVTLRRWQLECEWAVGDAQKVVRLAATERMAHDGLLAEKRRLKAEREEARKNAVTFVDWIRTEGPLGTDPLVSELYAWWMGLKEPRPQGSTAIVSWMAARSKAPPKKTQTAREQLERLESWASGEKASGVGTAADADDLPF